MPISFRCPHCGKAVAVGQKCECIQNAKAAKTIYKQRKKVPYSGASSGAVYGSDPMYHSSLWKRLCIAAKEHYNHMDIYSWYVLGRIEAGTIVHHVIPIKDDYGKRFDINNLIYLTYENHVFIHQIYSQSAEQKAEMQQELMNLIRRWNDDVSRGFSQNGVGG